MCVCINMCVSLAAELCILLSAGYLVTCVLFSCHLTQSIIEYNCCCSCSAFIVKDYFFINVMFVYANLSVILFVWGPSSVNQMFTVQALHSKCLCQ